MTRSTIGPPSHALEDQPVLMSITLRAASGMILHVIVVSPAGSYGEFLLNSSGKRVY